MRRRLDSGRPAPALRTRALAAAAALAGIPWLLRRVAAGEAPPALGLIAGAAVLALIIFTLRWNKEALTALRQRGPKYDPKDVLRKERERLLRRAPDEAPPEGRK